MMVKKEYTTQYTNLLGKSKRETQERNQKKEAFCPGHE